MASRSQIMSWSEFSCELVQFGIDGGGHSASRRRGVHINRNGEV